MREVGPIEAPPPEPVDFVVPRMSPEIAIYKPLVWRVTESDLAPLADWLIPKLSRSWPRLNDGAIIHWLRSSISDPHFLLIRTENVCALMQTEMNILEPMPMVKEVFCESKDGVTHEECFDLYRFVVNWALQIKAVEFMFFPPFTSGGVRARANKTIPVIGDEILLNLRQKFDDLISTDKRYGNLVRLHGV